MIHITLQAQQQIVKNLQQANASMLRVGVTQAGCSGWMYKLDAATASTDHDVIFDVEGIQVVVDKDHLDKLDNITIDYVKEGVNQLFRFINPNATAECGCGESFTL